MAIRIAHVEMVLAVDEKRGGDSPMEMVRVGYSRQGRNEQIPMPPRANRRRRDRGHPMWRCTLSMVEGPGSAAATHGPGSDGSMMPASSQL